MGWDAMAARFLSWLLLLLLPLQPKRQLALGAAPWAELGDRISMYGSSRPGRKPPPCVLDLPHAPLVGAGRHLSTWQRWGKDCCVSSTGRMSVCAPGYASMRQTMICTFGSKAPERDSDVVMLFEEDICT